MKKIFLLFPVFVFAFLLTGCTEEYYLDYNEMTHMIKRVSIVEVQRNEYYGEISIEQIKELNETDLAVFLGELTELKYEYSVFLEPENNTGLSIMLTYDSPDYDYVIIGKNGIEKFKDNKELSFFNARCDENEFLKIVNRYLND